MEKINLIIKNGQPAVSSKKIADNFGKEHKSVIRNVENLLNEISAQNCTDLFIPSTYKDSYGREQKEYLLTRDGFSLLVMGFTGTKALQWKLKYIEAFNQMEATIKQQKKQITSLTKQQEIEARLKNAKVREANLYLKIADKVGIPEYKQIMYSKATEVLSGEQLLPLPVTERKSFTAGEIGEKLGISANMVGRLSNKYNLKTNEYGVEVWDKAKNCSKQIPTFRYYENVIPVLSEKICQI
ncbi:Rha family transcriptional regulator [Clostridium sporogenes]|uniref:Rha family transcriptional regulator n=1 Tax=Clostridium sporogenes TaxID=1509 RepID=UPI003F92B329